MYQRFDANLKVVNNTNANINKRLCTNMAINAVTGTNKIGINANIGQKTH